MFDSFVILFGAIAFIAVVLVAMRRGLAGIQ